MKVLTVTLHPAVDRFIRVTQLVPGQPANADVLKVYSGGKGINAARTLHRLGVSTAATGFQGGKTGEFCIESLKREGIAASFISCEQPTRVTTVIYETNSGNYYPIYEPRQAVTKNETRQLIDHFEAMIGDFDLCLLCGAGEGPDAAQVYERMIGLAAEKKVRCFLDSSGAALANGLKAKPYLVKINLNELAELIEKQLAGLDEQFEVLKRIVREGVKIAAVSNEEKGLVATDGDHLFQSELVLDRVRNTTGCGDAMLAGMASAFLKGLPLSEIIRSGVACGTANTQNLGAGFIDADLANALLPEIEVRSVNKEED